MSKSAKKEIVDKAIDLFAAKGISKVSVIMLAKEMGSSKGKIYYYFQNGKTDIIEAILQIFEDCVSRNITKRNECETKEANVENILHKIFFTFPPDEAVLMRKILRIIMSEMYFDAQIAQHVTDNIITGREKMLAECFQSFVNKMKIESIDAGSIARFLNRLIFVYAMEDALHYHCLDNGERLEAQEKQMVRDGINFFNLILKKRYRSL